MNKTKLEIVRRFPHYRMNRVYSQYKSSSSPVQDDGSLTRLIFAPDPVLGNPRSDLAIIMSKDSAPEVAQFVRDVLMSPVETTKCIDADTALEMTKGTHESFEMYAERLREIVQKDYESKKL